MQRQLMESRARVIREIRAFFLKHRYLEVDTPILAPAVIPENPIELFKTCLFTQSDRSIDLFLLPSPELYLKKLIAEGIGNIFQLSKCFRNRESIVPFHSPEFLMLEWYSMDDTYQDSMLFTELLIERVWDVSSEATKRTLPFERIPINHYFRQFAGIDLERCKNKIQFQDAIQSAGLAQRISMNNNQTWADLFESVFAASIEPNIPTDRPVFLVDYPKAVPCLAKRIPDSPWCERWELYLSGVEVANCYTEETDPVKIRAFFSAESRRIEERGGDCRSDAGFIDLFEEGFPPCSGVALGVDRLLMVLFGKKDISQVIYHPLSPE